MLCPHSVPCLCFRYESQIKQVQLSYTTMIGFYNRNRLHCTVRPESLNTVRVKLGRALDQAVSHRSLTADAQVQFPVSPRESCGGQCSTGTDFSQGTSVPPTPVNIIPAMLHTSGREMCSLNAKRCADTFLQWLI